MTFVKTATMRRKKKRKLEIHLRSTKRYEVMYALYVCEDRGDP